MGVNWSDRKRRQKTAKEEKVRRKKYKEEKNNKQQTHTCRKGKKNYINFKNKNDLLPKRKKIKKKKTKNIIRERSFLKPFVHFTIRISKHFLGAFLKHKLKDIPSLLASPLPTHPPPVAPSLA